MGFVSFFDKFLYLKNIDVRTGIAYNTKDKYEIKDFIILIWMPVEAGKWELYKNKK